MKKAFTIIELVIAMIIFWLWIMMILLTLNKNVSLLKEVEIKTKATLLAKDQLAIFFNFRDSNKVKYKKWNYITWTDVSEQDFEAWKKYKVWTNLSWYNNEIEEISHPNFVNTRLYYKTWVIVNQANNADIYSWFYYTYKNTWKKSPFARYIILSWTYLSPEWWTKNDMILKVVSKVIYRFWAYSWEVNLESFVSDWR